MKNKSIFLVASLSLLLSFFAHSKENEKNILRTLAETEECVVLSEYAIVENVSRRQKIYINLDEVDFVESTGRIVYSEIHSDFPRPGVMGGTDINSFIEPIVNYDYYYIADQNNPKIVGKTEIKNDVQSLIIMLKELEERADSYGLSGTNKINAMLGYIRSFNSAYRNSSGLFGTFWGAIAGSENESFFNYIDSGYRPNHGYSLNSYFSSFNLKLNQLFPNDFFDNSEDGEKRLFLRDTNLHNDIDLIHMFASIDGIYDYTGASFIDDVVFLNDEQQDLISWAGDLQSEINRLHSIPNCLDNISSFDDILSMNGKFPREDFLSDLHAMNITRNFLNSNISYSLSDCLESYFDVSYAYNDYIYDFVYNITAHCNLGNASILTKLKYVIYKFAAVGYNASNDTCYNNYFQIVHPLYLIFYQDGFLVPSYSLRYAISTYFINYLSSYL